jgi:ABC-type Zn uptake system ZnuABC Zn-binding protein ZnuA
VVLGRGYDVSKTINESYIDDSFYELSEQTQEQFEENRKKLIKEYEELYKKLRRTGQLL